MASLLRKTSLMLFVCATATFAQQSKSSAIVTLRVSALKINVEDMDKALSFYGEKLGFEVADRSEYPREVVLKTGDSFKLMLNSVSRLQRVGAIAVKASKQGKVVAVEDPFGNVSEIVEAGTFEIQKLKKLYDEKRYFELRDSVERLRGKADSKLLFFRGVVANVFNQPQRSSKYLKQYIALVRKDDDLLPDAYTLLADNFIKVFDYKKAAGAYRMMLARFKQTLKPDELEDYENSVALYDALSAVPPQRVVVGTHARLNESGTEAGWSVPVDANGQRVMLGMDTGANISLLAKSVAEKLGVKMLDRSISMGSITSIKVQPRLGFLPMMKIGRATIHNAVFIVMEDHALTFPDGFVLKGVIGFPVIAGLGSISFDSDGTVFVSQKSYGAVKPNMCLEGKNILFQGEYENKLLTFVLDTGAERSILYLPFLRDFEDEIKAKYSLGSEKFTGVGGTEEVPAYLVKDFKVRFSGRDVSLPEVRLLTKALTDNGKYFYGNVGQDLIKHYRRVTLDFVSMHIAFE